MTGLSVIIPTLNAAGTLPATVAALGGEFELIVADGGSQDDTVEVAARLGARVVTAARGRGPQLIAGAEAARGQWLLFLHADTVVDPDWRAEAAAFMNGPEYSAVAAVFRFTLDDSSASARWLERVVAWRGRVFCLPYGDQGLLIHRELYRAVGGFHALPLMEDVDMVRRIGCARLHVFQSAAVTSAAKWRRDGWLKRSLRNLFCLTLYFAGVPPRVLVHLYGRP
jgi:rSAM/selenodomain-associated transferase 2